MLSVNGNSHIIHDVLKVQNFGPPKSCFFNKIVRGYLIDSTPRVELNCMKVASNGPM